MDLAQLIEQRKASVALLQEIVAGGKSEKRKLSAVETRSFNAAKAEVEQIDAQIAKKQTGPGPLNIRTEMKTTPKFSLIKAIRSVVNNEAMDDVSIAVIDAGKADMRAAGLAFKGDIILPFEDRAVIMATSAGSGQENVAEQKLNMIEPLRASLVAVQAGATFLTNLVGDVSIPTYAGSSAAWKGEGITAVDGAGATGEVTLSPKRLTAFIDISKQFIAQDSSQAEALLMRDLVAAVSGKLEATIFGKEAASATQPGGLFAVAPTIAGVASWDNVVALETAVDTANALATCQYITNASGRGLLKKTVKVANQATYLMNPDGTMNGYPVLVTNHVASALQVGANEFGIVFGNWAEYLIGSWGAIDLLVDPFTQAHLGNVRVHINGYFDAKPRRTAAFKTGSMK